MEVFLILYFLNPISGTGITTSVQKVNVSVEQCEYLAESWRSNDNRYGMEVVDAYCTTKKDSEV